MISIKAGVEYVRIEMQEIPSFKENMKETFLQAARDRMRQTGHHYIGRQSYRTI